jgi:NAD(P)-dependent dehydrogenase (short-subunit alcohol dehydrogenase family)
MNRPLEGRVAVVTGASSGIGAATAVAFAEAGAQVVITGRDRARLAETEAAIAAVGGTSASVAGDLGDPAFSHQVIDHGEERLGPINVVANVAGTITRGDVTDTSDDDWRRNFTANVDSVFFLSRAAVVAMRRHGEGGTIVNLASNVGVVGAAGLPAYCASKGAVVLLTKSMALDHAAEGIRVNALCPGAVDTPMLISEHERSGLTADEVMALNLASIPEGRIPAPDEIAKSMLYLASDMSSHVTGVALAIDGGYLAQ